MKIIGTDGKLYTLNPKKSAVEEDSESKSLLHKQARLIIKQCLPYSTIYEEITLTGCKGSSGTLRADFFIPELPLLIEIHGEQHYKFVKHFHKSEIEFSLAQKNDTIKKEWCALNDIGYVELPFNKIKEWKNLINAALE